MYIILQQVSMLFFYLCVLLITKCNLAYGVVNITSRPENTDGNQYIEKIIKRDNPSQLDIGLDPVIHKENSTDKKKVTLEPKDENANFDPKDENADPKDENANFEPKDENANFDPKDENATLGPKDEIATLEQKEEYTPSKPKAGNLRKKRSGCHCPLNYLKVHTFMTEERFLNALHRIAGPAPKNTAFPPP